jgi:hypothetical protein
VLARTLRIAVPASALALTVAALTGCGSGPDPSAGSPAGPGPAGKPSAATGSPTPGTAGASAGQTDAASGSPPKAGPGGSGPAATPAPTGTATEGPLPDPCGLLTRAQVAAVLPGAGPATADPSADGQRGCRWTSTAAGHGFVQLVVNHGDARRSAAANRDSLGDLELVDLEGASFGYLAGNGWVAGAQVRTVFVQLTLTPTNRAAVLRLARAAVAAA